MPDLVAAEVKPRVDEADTTYASLNLDGGNGL
jgi:hypothetical protein